MMRSMPTPTADPATLADTLRAARTTTFIVVPAYCEQAAIGAVLRELVTAYPNVVVVDDGSRDQTFAAARAVAPFVIRHPLNRGQGAALQTGIRFALDRGAHYIVTFDSDGQHRVEDIPRLLAPLVTNQAAVALGSRFLEPRSNVPPARRLLLRGAIFFTRLTSGLQLTDAHNGLRAFNRSAATQLEITMDRMAHASEIIDQVRRHRLRYSEVPVEIRYTDYSLAKGQRARDAVRVLWQYLVDRWAR